MLVRAVVSMTLSGVLACSTPAEPDPYPLYGAASGACGNNLRETGEACDGADLGGATCVQLGFDVGTLGCKPGCRDFDRARCGAPPTCGDDTRQGDEICDGADLESATCASLGKGTGVLSCLPSCGDFDTTGCGASACPASKDCSGRECGPDPVCEESCGTCATGACNGDGRCESGDPAGPTIVSLTSNIATMTSNDTLILSALVSDPDGVTDILGGLLEDTVGGGTYGTFVAAGSAGSYTLSLGWQAINTVRPIDTGAGGGTRVFRARFYDAASHQTTRDLPVLLTCRTDSQWALCAGVCRDSESDAYNCNVCGHACEGPEPSCTAGSCAPCSGTNTLCGSACVDLSEDRDNCGACNRSVPGGYDECRDGDFACYSDYTFCDSHCVNTTYDDSYCGGCDHACDSAPDFFCSDSLCLKWLYTYSQQESCTTVCGAAGLSCHEATSVFSLDTSHCTCSGLCDFDYDIGCDELPGYGDGCEIFNRVDCYCY